MVVVLGHGHHVARPEDPRAPAERGQIARVRGVLNEQHARRIVHAEKGRQMLARALVGVGGLFGEQVGAAMDVRAARA